MRILSITMAKTYVEFSTEKRIEVENIWDLQNLLVAKKTIYLKWMPKPSKVALALNKPGYVDIYIYNRV